MGSGVEVDADEGVGAYKDKVTTHISIASTISVTLNH